MRSLALLALAGSYLSAASKPPTFYKDVLPILQSRCQSCHRPGEAAPMSFLTYKDARPWAASIREAVVSRKMPPWGADPAHGKFLNDRRLLSSEIDTIVNWTKSGALAGDPADAPETPAWAEGWTIGKPDLILDVGYDFTVPAKGDIPYTNFIVRTGFTEDKWIEKIEVRPSNRSVVHHVVVRSRPPNANFLEEARPGIPYAPPVKPPNAQTIQTDSGESALGEKGVEIVGIYVPGGIAYETRKGQARLIRAGSDLIFSMHYTTNGKEAVDRTRVGIVFATTPPKERVVHSEIANRSLRIPPGAANHRVAARLVVQEPVRIQSLFPHMHLRGKAMQIRAIYPTGEDQILLSVPNYEFNWQLTYALAEPVTLPKGTEVEVTGWFDNSRNNKWNPDPTSEVFWGQQTWEEMMIGFVDLAIPISLPPDRILGPISKRAAVAPSSGLHHQD